MSEPTPRETALESWHTGRLLTAAARMIEHAFDSGLGVTHAGVNVLGALADGPLAQGELAGHCQVQDQTMSRIIDGLERSGYAVRRRDTGDRRRVLVERTEAGGQVMDRAREVAAARLGDLLDVPPEERAICRGFLIKIIRSLGRGCPMSR